MTERVTVLRSWLAHTPATSVAKTAAGSDAPPAWLADLPEANRMTAFAAVAGRRLLAWSFDPEEDCFFRGDDPIAMLHHSPGMLARAAPREPFPDFDALDPLACLLRFEVLSEAPREASWSTCATSPIASTFARSRRATSPFRPTSRHGSRVPRLRPSCSPASGGA